MDELEQRVAAQIMEGLNYAQEVFPGEDGVGCLAAMIFATGLAAGKNLTPEETDKLGAAAIRVAEKLATISD